MLEFRRRALLAIGLLATLAGGCATRAAAPPVVVEPISAEEIAGVSALLRLEDRQEADLEVLRSAAESGSPVLRARAAIAAARIGSPATNALVRDLLEDPDTAVLSAAAFAAGQLRDTSAVAQLAELLDTAAIRTRPTVATEAATALGKIGGDQARVALNSFLSSAGEADSASVGAALIGAWRAGENSLTPYTLWLSAASPEVRWRAVYALTRRPRPDAVSLLLPLLDDSEPLARAFALRGLGFPVVSAAGQDPGELLPQLIEALADDMYAVRIEAIRAVGSYPDARAAAALEELLRTGEPHQIITALESLAGTGRFAAAARPTVLRIFEDRTAPAFIRESALGTVVALGPEEARTVVQSATEDDSWRVRAAAANLWPTYRDAALPPLQELARDADPRVAAAAIDAAIRAAGMSGIQSLRPLLIESLAASDVQVRAAALRGFSWLADPATFPMLLDAYERARHDQQNDAAIAAIDAIAELGLVGVLNPERAFFTRFPRPADYLVHQRAISRFRDAARSAWGEALPLESGTTLQAYYSYVEDWSSLPPGHRSLPQVRIETSEGPIDLLLYADEAPLTAANFLMLARSGFFDNQEWARLIPDFVLQGGDPRGDTSGGPGYSIRDELNRHLFLTGTLGMALSGPDTGGSQFYITHSPQPHLDGGYTVFGTVIAGQEVVERLLPGQRIVTVRVLEEPNE